MVRSHYIEEKTRKDNSTGIVYLQTAGLTPEVNDRVVEYYNRKLDNPADIIYHDDMQKIAFYKTIEYGFLDLFLFNVESDQFLFNQGYFHQEVRPLLKNYLHRLNENNRTETYPVYLEERLYEIELRLILHNSKKYIFGIIVHEAINQTESVNSLVKFFSRYYFSDFHHYTGLCEYNGMPALNKILKATAEKAQRNAQRLHYILIQIEPLKKYIKVAGDYLVNEIIKNTQEMITDILQENGQCFTLNSRQYLITMTNMDDALIKEKFGHAHFRIKNLLLIYQMNYYEVTDFENGYTIETVWPSIKIK